MMNQLKRYRQELFHDCEFEINTMFYRRLKEHMTHLPYAGGTLDFLGAARQNFAHLQVRSDNALNLVNHQHLLLRPRIPREWRFLNWGDRDSGGELNNQTATSSRVEYEQGVINYQHAELDNWSDAQAKNDESYHQRNRLNLKPCGFFGIPRYPDVTYHASFLGRYDDGTSSSAPSRYRPYGTHSYCLDAFHI